MTSGGYGESRLCGHARDDGVNVAREDGRVDVDRIRVENFRELERGQERVRKEIGRCEGVFVWAIFFFWLFSFRNRRLVSSPGIFPRFR